MGRTFLFGILGALAGALVGAAAGFICASLWMMFAQTADIQAMAAEFEIASTMIGTVGGALIGAYGGMRVSRQ